MSGGRPGSRTVPPGGTCAPCTTGNLEVTVYRYKVCWDTGPEGIHATDPPFEGVEVSIGSTPPPVVTGPDGVARFNGIRTGTYTVRAQMAGFRDVTPTVTPEATASAEVRPSQTTVADPRILQMDDLECNRRHAARPGGAPGGTRIRMPFLWVGGDRDEPWILIIRDVLWLLAIVFMIVGFALVNLPLAALMMAFVGYLTNLIFGKGAGIPVIVVAGVFFVLATALALAEFFGAAIGLPSPGPVWVPWLCGTWTGFLFALLLGRTEHFSASQVWPWVVAGVLGFVVAIVLYIVMGGFFTPTSGGQWAGMIIAWIFYIIMCFAWPAIAGLLAHAFRNDGQTEAQVWGATDFELPFAGERYCVQGLRGIISHFEWQEFAYDWAMPEGREILCAKEGHITQIREDRDGAAWRTGNQTANEVRVRHRDQSVAEYLHLVHGGITQFNPGLVAVASQLASNPVHVHPGQVLGGAGNVGISMFNHLHFQVEHGPGQASNPGPAANFLPVKFQDADTARHENRCVSMRKYASGNVNRGPVIVPPSPAPFQPGSAPAASGGGS